MRDTTHCASGAVTREGAADCLTVASDEVRRAVAQTYLLPPLRRDRVEAARKRQLRGERPSPAQIADAILRHSGR